MKKVLLVMFILLFVVMSGCSKENVSVEEAILEKAEVAIEGFDLVQGQEFSVYLDDGIYHININGDELLIKLEKHIHDVAKSNTEELNSDLMTIVKKSREKVIEFIKQSKILKDKDKLMNYINGLNIQIADFSQNSGAAEYDLHQDTIYINRIYKEDVCEWMVVHEYIHALCQKTNGGEQNLRYPYQLFNEALTDIITAELNPRLSKNIESGYKKYYEFIYLYLGCTGMEGLEAYFYGYDEILKSISGLELDIFVESIEQVEMQENAIVIICNCINKWGLEGLINNQPFSCINN